MRAPHPLTRAGALADYEGVDMAETTTALAYVEDVEEYNAEHGSVFVFRWVPHFNVAASLDEPQPDTADFAARLALASEGLQEGGMVAHRQVYDVTHYGVDGHRPMTETERATYRAQLEARLARTVRDLNALQGAVDCD